MRIEISSKNYKPNNNLKDLLEKKISKFEKYFKKQANAKVVLSISGTSKFTMEITIISNNMRVRSEVTSENMFDNIDVILPKIERQIVKYRKRFENKPRKEDFEQAPIYEDNEKLTEDDYAKYGKLVREKKFEIAMSTVEEAIEEMELLAHNFFVFLNADNEKVSVVYKRNDGDYGLISPEY